MAEGRDTTKLIDPQHPTPPASSQFNILFFSTTGPIASANFQDYPDDLSPWCAKRPNSLPSPFARLDGPGLVCLRICTSICTSMCVCVRSM